MCLYIARERVKELEGEEEEKKNREREYSIVEGSLSGY